MIEKETRIYASICRDENCSLLDCGLPREKTRASKICNIEGLNPCCGRPISSKAEEHQLESSLSNNWRRNNGSHGGGDGDNGGRGSLAIDLSLGALARNVTSLAAAVARLSGSIQWATVGGGTVAGDVTQLAAGVTLHGLGLTITGEVVGSTAFVASGLACTTGETATESASKASTRGPACTTTGSNGWVGACTLSKRLVRRPPVRSKH